MHRFSRLPSVLLGLLICGHLLFLVLENGRNFLFPATVPTTPLAKTLVDWGELTGQAQNWSLFALAVRPKTAIFAIAVLETPEGDIEFPSRFLPEDPEQVYRWPIGPGRLYLYEYALIAVYANATPESLAAEPALWKARVRDHVAAYQRPMRAWLAWQTGYRKGSALRLEVRVLFSAEPGEVRRAAVTLPLARFEK